MAQEPGQGALRPLPEITDDNRPFWEGCRRHQLLVQRCRACGACRLGSPICPQCWGLEAEWVPASGRGRVYTWSIMYQRYHPFFHQRLPYNLTVVELEEGPRLLTNLVGVRNEDIRADLPVEVEFEDVDEEVSLPVFRPAQQG